MTPGSNAVSRALGYRANGTGWVTRRGEAGLLQRWRLTRADWQANRDSDIVVHGLAGVREVLGIA